MTAQRFFEGLLLAVVLLYTGAAITIRVNAEAERDRDFAVQGLMNRKTECFNEFLYRSQHTALDKISEQLCEAEARGDR